MCIVLLYHTVAKSKYIGKKSLGIHRREKSAKMLYGLITLRYNDVLLFNQEELTKFCAIAIICKMIKGWQNQMNYKSIDEIKKQFDIKGIRYSCVNRNTSEIVQVGFPIENGPSITALYIARDDDNDIAIRVYGLITHIKKSKREQILEVINTCNSKYRFFKFYIDGDNDVNLEYDFLSESNNIGPMALEALVRISSILDEAYPLMMKVLYS